MHDLPHLWHWSYSTFCSSWHVIYCSMLVLDNVSQMTVFITIITSSVGVVRVHFTLPVPPSFSSGCCNGTFAFVPWWHTGIIFCFLLLFCFFSKNNVLTWFNVVILWNIALIEADVASYNSCSERDEIKISSSICSSFTEPILASFQNWVPES